MQKYRHLIKQQKALEKTLDKLIKEMYKKALAKNNIKNNIIDIDTSTGTLIVRLEREPYNYEYSIERNCLYITPSTSFIKKIENGHYELPSLETIIEESTKMYKNFDSNEISKVIYCFSDCRLKGNVEISAPNSEIMLNSIVLDGNITIQKANYVEIFNSRCVSNCDVSIRANKIKLSMFNIHTDKPIILISNDIEISDMYIESSEDIIISSSLLTFTNTGIKAKEIDMSANMIDSDNSTIKAERKIVILDKNNDAIKGIESPVVIYNGYDITHSEGLEMPKLKERLLDNLKKMKDVINSYIEKSTESYNQSLKKVPITEILNKKNI